MEGVITAQRKTDKLKNRQGNWNFLKVVITSYKKFEYDKVKNNDAENKSAVVRNALRFFREEFELREILLASQEVKDGKILKGDLRELAKKFK